MKNLNTNSNSSTSSSPADSRVTVITPNYNHAHYLPQMLDSTLSQSTPPHQLIVVDDASTDNSHSLLLSYQEKFPALRIIKNESNLGAAQSVNKGIQAATGDFLVFRSADDLTLPGAFQKSLAMLHQHPQAGLCCGDITHFFDDSPSRRTEPASLPPTPKYYSPQDTINVLASNPIFGHTVMARTSAAKSAGAYHPELLWYSDWFFFLTIALRHGFCYIPEPLAANRLRANSLGNATMANSDIQKSVLKAMITLILNNYPDFLQPIAQSRVLNNFNPLLTELYQESTDLDTPQAHQLLDPVLDLPPSHKSGIAQVIKNTLSIYKHTFNFLHKNNPHKHFYVYGAGSHTASLLTEWNKLNLPKISALLQTDPPHHDSFQGIPIQTLDSISPSQTHLIIISSKSFEEAMVHNVHKLLPTPKILTFWNISKTTLKPM